MIIKTDEFCQKVYSIVHPPLVDSKRLLAATIRTSNSLGVVELPVGSSTTSQLWIVWTTCSSNQASIDTTLHHTTPHHTTPCHTTPHHTTWSYNPHSRTHHSTRRAPHLTI